MTIARHVPLATALALALSAGVAFAQEPIRVATEGAYPPFNYFDADGTLQGFDVEIAKALCAEMERECTFVAQDWDGIIPGLQGKKYDMIVASMFITDEREEQVDFTDPYYKAAMTWVVPKGSDITEITEGSLDGKVAGVQGSTTQGKYIEGVHPEAELRRYRTQDEVNLDLSTGRLDLQMADLVPMMEWLKTDEGACCERVGEPITDPEFVGAGVGIALREEDDTLREEVNAALATILEDGTYKEINDRFFDINVYTMEP